jgi:hypothetical protein
VSKLLSKDLTALDIIKTIVVVIMIIDHTGGYFFPEHVGDVLVQENLWWRAIGRIGFPVWFFLPGYARGRDIGRQLWLGALILFLGNIVGGMYLLPLNALVTIMIIRLSVDEMVKDTINNRFVFWGVALLLALLAYPSQMFMEYGTLGLMMGVFGWIARRRDEIPGGRRLCLLFAIYSFVAFVGLEWLFFKFSLPQFLFMAAFTGVTVYTLYRYEPKTYPGAEKYIGGVGVKICQFMGRRTLEIYVFHLLLFKAINLALEPSRLFQFTFVG